MRRKIALTLALVVTLSVGIIAGRSGIGFATSDHRDVLINATITEAPSGPFAGDRVELWGSGFFSLDTGQVKVRGAFVHRHSNGVVVAKGWWVATVFQSFTSYGTIPGTPLEGGRAVFTVVLHPDGAAPVTFTDFTVTCVVGSPPPDAEEGVTVGPFTESIDQSHRFTLFFQI